MSSMDKKPISDELSVRMCSSTSGISDIRQVLPRLKNNSQDFTPEEMDSDVCDPSTHSFNVHKALLECKYNSKESPGEEYLSDVLPNFICALKDGVEDELFDQILKQLFNSLFHLPIEDWENVILKESLEITTIHMTELLSKLELKINQPVEEHLGPDIVSLIQYCENVMNAIYVLLDTTMCQYPLVSSKIPSLFRYIPDILHSVYKHCMQNKDIYDKCDDNVKLRLKKFHLENKSIQATFLSLLEEKVDFSDSQEKEVLVGSLEKLCKLAELLVDLDVSSGYILYKAYCNLAIKYVENLKRDLHVTPAVQAMVNQVEKCFRTSHADQDETTLKRTIKLFRAFVKLIIELVDNYQGYLREAHKILIEFLITLYNHSSHQTDDNLATLVESGGNNLFTCAHRDPYFMSEFFNVENSSPGYVNLCVLVIKKSLQEANNIDTKFEDNKLPLVQHVFRVVAAMQVEDFIWMATSGKYKKFVSSLVALCSTLSADDYSTLEMIMFRYLLSSSITETLFTSDMWFLLLGCSTGALLRDTILFFLNYLAEWNPRVYNFQYINLMQFLKRLLWSAKPNAVKKLFENGTLSFTQYPILIKLKPDHIQCEPVPVILSQHIDSFTKVVPSLESYDCFIKPLWYSGPVEDIDNIVTLVKCIQPTNDSLHFVEIVFSIFLTNANILGQNSLTIILQHLSSLLASSCCSKYLFLRILKLLSQVDWRNINDSNVVEDLCGHILLKLGEVEDDYSNKYMASAIASFFNFDKDLILKLLQKKDKLDLMTNIYSKAGQSKYEDLKDLKLKNNNQFPLRCNCERMNTNKENIIKSKDNIGDNELIDDGTQIVKNFNNDVAVKNKSVVNEKEIQSKNASTEGAHDNSNILVLSRKLLNSTDTKIDEKIHINRNISRKQLSDTDTTTGESYNERSISVNQLNTDTDHSLENKMECDDIFDQGKERKRFKLDEFNEKDIDNELNQIERSLNNIVTHQSCLNDAQKKKFHDLLIQFNAKCKYVTE